MLSPSDFNNAVPQFTNGNYASNPINPQYIAEPDAESYNRGTEPLQTLPAQWWNWFVNKFTARFNKVNIYVKNIFNELAQVLSIFNITPDGTEQTPTTSQLKTVFETCYPRYVKTQTTGTAVGCIPTVGTALGTTNNNILVTDSTGKLKPSGITVGTAAGCDAALLARKTEIDALYGNVAGTALGTAAVGTCTTFARSDHVHPVTGLVTTTVDSTGCPGIGDAGNYTTFIRTTAYGFIPYCVDTIDGSGYLGVNGWPFKEVHAKNFYGTLHGNADTASYACQATGPIPFDAAEEARPLGARVRAVVAKGTTEVVGYRSRMAIGQMYCGAWAHGLISVGCSDDGTEWDDFIFPVGHGGTVITSTTIGSQLVACATCACRATCANNAFCLGYQEAGFYWRDVNVCTYGDSLVSRLSNELGILRLDGASVKKCDVICALKPFFDTYMVSQTQATAIGTALSTTGGSGVRVNWVDFVYPTARFYDNMNNVIHCFDINSTDVFNKIHILVHM